MAVHTPLNARLSCFAAVAAAVLDIATSLVDVAFPAALASLASALALPAALLESLDITALLDVMIRLLSVDLASIGVQHRARLSYCNLTTYALALWYYLPTIIPLRIMHCTFYSKKNYPKKTHGPDRVKTLVLSTRVRELFLV